MSQEGRGCLVGDQGGSDKVAQFKMEQQIQAFKDYPGLLDAANSEVRGKSFNTRV